METIEANTKTKWSIDPAHTEIGFRVKHLMIANVRGSFKEYDASIYTTAEDFMNSQIDVKLSHASVWTGDEKRDAHLKRADFFDVENFNEINFISNTFEKSDKRGHYTLQGDLSMKGIKKQINLDVVFCGVTKDTLGFQKAAFNINGKINRKDWGLNWNAALETGGVLVSEEVWIICELQLVKQS